MSAADSSSGRTGRIRRREEDGDDGQTAKAVEAQPDHPTVGAAMSTSSSLADSPATDDQPPQPPPPSDGVQPLPEQIRKKPRRSPRFSSPLDTLALVELQLVMQLLDTKSRLKAARCSRALLQAASAPFAWSAPAGVTVTVWSAADVQRVCSSLIRFGPVHLECIDMDSLDCVAAVPHLVGIELLDSRGGEAPVDLPQLLQHPNSVRLQELRLDLWASMLQTVDTMRLIARLPQLRTFELTVPAGPAAAALMQPLTDAPALTDFTAGFGSTDVDADILRSISGCAGLRRLRLHHLSFPNGTFATLCSSPNMRRLQHLQLDELYATFASPWPDPNEYGVAFSALQQLQSLTLIHVWDINLLLAHLHRAPALRLLSIRCQPDDLDIGIDDSPLPRRAVLGALLTASPHLEVRLVLPSDLHRWKELDLSIRADDDMCERQWRELQRMAAEMDRVTAVDEEALFE